MKSDQRYCLGGSHFSRTKNQSVYEKLKPKTKNLVRIIKGTCSICGRNKSQVFTK